MTSIPFTDLQTQYRSIQPEVESGIRRVLEHGHYILGPEIAELESALGAFVGTRHAIACSSGTDALLVALMALGVKRGDVVLTTPFTFFATAEVIALLDAIPVFVDVKEHSFNIDPAALERAIEAVRLGDPSIHPLPRGVDMKGRKSAGVIAVDLFGLPAEYDSISGLCTKSDIFLLEDAAQSFGAAFHGRKACSFGQIAATSFFPAKPLGCYGDGGMVFTDSDTLADLMRSLVVHGKGTDKYDNLRIGLNGRLDTLQAAILLAKFAIFEQETEARQKRADAYGSLLRRFCSANVLPPEVPEGFASIWAQYTVRLSGRSNLAVQQLIQKAGIPTAIYYPRPLHLQTAFGYLGYREGDFPVSEKLSREVLSLPFGPYIANDQQETVVRALADALAATPRHAAV
jgi:UDP-2-acetamido-2-deoxy-ribo-hexuluronate aminotransferase